MAREEIFENDLESVVGGSIVLKSDKSTCGYNRNDQYKILDYSSFMKYVKANIKSMDERDILKNCVNMGYLTANN